MKVATNQERLNELFDADPRSDTAIAADLGVSKQAISMWRNGTRSPKKSVLVQISKAYNVSIEWLMGFDVEKNASSIHSPLVIPDTERFKQLVSYMSQDDYLTMMSIFERTYEKMKEMGVDTK